MPSWVNLFTVEKIPEHRVLEPLTRTIDSGGVAVTVQQFDVDFDYDDFPQ